MQRTKVRTVWKVILFISILVLMRDTTYIVFSDDEPQPNGTLPPISSNFNISGLAFEGLNVEWLNDTTETGWTTGANVPCVRLTNTYTNVTLTTHQLFVPDAIPVNLTPGVGAFIQYRLEEWHEGISARIQYTLQYPPYYNYEYPTADLASLLGNQLPTSEGEAEEWIYYAIGGYHVYDYNTIVNFEGNCYQATVATSNIWTPPDNLNNWNQIDCPSPGSGSNYPANEFSTGAKESYAYDNFEERRVFDIADLTDTNAEFNVSWTINVKATEGYVIVNYSLYYENSTTIDLVHQFEDMYDSPMPPVADTIQIDGLSVSIDRDTPDVYFQSLMKVSYDKPTADNYTFDLTNNTFTQHYEKEDILFYPTEINETGALEFCVILKEKPLSNVLNFDIEGQRLIFTPNNGGYSVYYDNTNLPVGAFILEGKLFEIYRPKIIDKNGNWVYGNLLYENNILSLSIPQSFLDDTDRYPIYVDPIYGDIGAVIDTWEFDTEECRIHSERTMIRINESQYFVLVGHGDTGADDDGFLRTFNVSDAGTITKSLISKIEFDTGRANPSSICQIPGTDKYVIAYMGTSYLTVKTYTIYANNGTVGSNIDTETTTVTYKNDAGLDIIHLYGEIFVVRAPSSDLDEWIYTFNISSAGVIDNTLEDSEEVADAVTTGWGSLEKVDDDTIAIVYSDGSGDSYLYTYNITSAGLITDTPSSSWKTVDYASGWRRTQIRKVSGNVFAIVYTDTSQDGYVKTIWIDNNGTINTTQLDVLKFDNDAQDWTNLFQVQSGVWGVAFRGETYDGYVTTFNLSDSGLMDESKIESLECYSADVYAAMSIAYAGNSTYVICHSDGDADGRMCTFRIETAEVVLFNPVNSEPYPYGVTLFTLNPSLNITVNSTYGYTMNQTFWTNESGTWVAIGWNNNTANATLSNTTSCFDSYNIEYWWSSNVTDGHDGWDNDTYNFAITVSKDTSVDAIIPYNQTSSTLTINATGSSYLDNVTLYYRYSNDNITWHSSTGWYDINWSYRNNITLNSSQVNATLTNFPVLINITSTNLRDYANDTGADILFTNATGTKLNHEIDYWDNTTGKLIAWVNVTSLSSSVDTVIYIYYGNTNATDQQNITGTWDSNYIFVLHMNDLTTSSTNDSTSYNHDGTKKDVNEPPVSTAGKIGYAQNFDGSDDYITLGDHDDYNTPNMTVECWFYKDSNKIGGTVNKHRANLNQKTWVFGFFDLPYTGYRFSWYTTTAGVGYSPPYYLNSQYVPADTSTGTETWYHSVGGCDGASLGDTAQQLGIGYMEGSIATGAPQNFFDGMIDEVRLSNINRSSSWIKTEYNNQFNSTDGGFFTLGTSDVWQVWDNPSNPDSTSPWSWDFDFPDGDGYYEFFSIGANNSNYETMKTSAEALCYFKFNNTVVYVDDDASAGWYDANHVKTINEANNNVTKTEKGTIYIWDGTYTEEVIWDDNTHGLDIIGNGSSSVFIDAGIHDSAFSIEQESCYNITGLNLSGGNNPLNLTGSDNITISDCNLSNNDSVYVISLYSSRNITIRNSNVSGNTLVASIAIDLDSIYIDILNNTINSSIATYAFMVDGDNVSLYNNTIMGNATYGIHLGENSSYGFVYNNNITGFTVCGYADPSVQSHRFNTTKTLGTNIIGGEYLGGNYYSDNTEEYDTDGFSEPYTWSCVVYALTNGSGNWTVPVGISSIDVLVVGGGGGAGIGTSSTERNGGGGGAGGLVWVQNISVTPGTNKSYSVGAGGRGGWDSEPYRYNGSCGQNTTFDNLTAVGGGGGGGHENRDGLSGGSGGGAGASVWNKGVGGSELQTGQLGYSGIYGHGYDGGDACIKAGILYYISVGGGGAGGMNSYQTGGDGMNLSSYFGMTFGVYGVFSHGGGSFNTGDEAVNNTGNGGRAKATNDASNGGPGGSGIILIRYKVNIDYLPLMNAPSNNIPELISPSVYPESGVASYTNFSFNITWYDEDCDTPDDGYLNVNISRSAISVTVDNATESDLPNECNDDNWSTYYDEWLNNPDYPSGSFFYFNYSIPSGTIESGCLWIKYTYDSQSYEENATIPINAFSEPVLSFRFSILWGSFNLDVYYDGDYYMLDTLSSGGIIDRLYEESVTFNVSSWSTNQSMNTVDGEYPPCYQGYNYSTTLSAGIYNFTFYAYDGTDYNSSGPHSGPTVESQSHSFSCTYLDAYAFMNFTIWSITNPDLTGTSEYNVSDDFEDAVNASIVVQNTGNVPINVSGYFTSALPTGLSMKYNTSSFTPPLPGENTIAVDPSSTLLKENLAVSGSFNLWFWMDFSHLAEEQTDSATFRLTSSLYGG